MFAELRELLCSGAIRRYVLKEEKQMSKDMTRGNPLGLILKFFIPVLLGSVFQQFYSMVDTIVVGKFVGVNAPVPSTF